MSKNHRRDRLPDIEVGAGSTGDEAAPFEVNEDGSPAGNAFAGEGAEAEEAKAAEEEAVEKAGSEGTEVGVPPPAADAATSPSGGGSSEADVPAEPGTIEPPPSLDATPNGEEPAKDTQPKALTRREQIVARIEEIERDGGPVGRTQRVNEEANEFAKEMHETARSMARKLGELRARTRKCEQAQQTELEEVRLLKLELTKLSD